MFYRYSSYDQQLIASTLNMIRGLIDAEFWRMVETRPSEAAELPPHILPADTLVAGALLWRLNKFINQPLLRSSVTARIVAQEIFSHAPQRDPPNEATALGARYLTDTGILHLPPALTPAEAHEVFDFLRKHGTPEAEHTVLHYPIGSVLEAPHLLATALNETVLAIVSTYLGAPATLMDVSVFESLPGSPEPGGAQIFHRDRDDFRACKLFIYLDDVGTDDGPHIFVRGSHDPKQVAARLNTADSAEVEILFKANGRAFSSEVEKIFTGDVTEIVGPAGTTFIENTYGFHRGKIPTSRRRVIFSAAYGTIPYPGRIHRFAAGRRAHSFPAFTPAQRYASRLLYEEVSN